MCRTNLLVLSGFAILGCSIALAIGPQPVPHRMPYKLIEPILKKNCVMCHMGAHPKHDLNLTSYASIMKGDKEGKVVVPGKVASSRLSKAVHRKGGASPMPP